MVEPNLVTPHIDIEKSTSSLPVNDENKTQVLKRLKIDSIIFIILVAAALIGVVMTNSAKTQAYLYWWVLMAIEAVVITVWAIWLSHQQVLNKPIRLVLYEQLVLWLAALAAVFLIYRLMGLGLVDINAAGLLMLLILAFATFIDGALVSWKLFLVSLIFIITLLFASYVEKFIWALILISLTIAALAIAVSYWHSHAKTA